MPGQPDKPTAAEMAEACQAESERVEDILLHFREHHPGVDETARERHMRALSGAASVMRIVATYPDECRDFFAALLKRHAAGE